MREAGRGGAAPQQRGAAGGPPADQPARPAPASVARRGCRAAPATRRRPPEAKGSRAHVSEGCAASHAARRCKGAARAPSAAVPAPRQQDGGRSRCRPAGGAGGGAGASGTLGVVRSGARRTRPHALQPFGARICARSAARQLGSHLKWLLHGIGSRSRAERLRIRTACGWCRVFLRKAWAQNSHEPAATVNVVNQMRGRVQTRASAAAARAGSHRSAVAGAARGPARRAAHVAAARAATAHHAFHGPARPRHAAAAAASGRCYAHAPVTKTGRA